MEQKLPINVITYRLAEIARAAPQIVWTTEIPDAQYGVTVSLPYSNYISGTFFPSQGRTLYIDIFSVDIPLQKGGIGSRLLRAFTTEGRKYDAQYLLGRCTSVGALKTRARVFSKDNLRFHSVDRLGKMGDIIPLQYEDLLQQSIETGLIDVGIGVDLTTIERSQWTDTI